MTQGFQNPLPIPVLGICAYSGTGKTTLLKKLIPALARRGIALAVIKHAHHDFDVDIPGKDSYELRKAGARQVLVASSKRWALMTEDPVPVDPLLAPLLAQLQVEQLDIVLVEGFKQLPLPKIELHRAALGTPFIHSQDNQVLAVACCNDTEIPAAMRRLAIDNIEQIADFVQGYIANWQPTEPSMASICDGHGGSDMTLSVRQALDKVLASVNPLTDIETIALDALDGRVLAENVISPVDVPAQTNAAMDGYAFCHATPLPAYLNLVGSAFAGHGFDGVLGPAQAIRIMTGAPLPAGADTVQPKELCEEQDQRLYLHGNPDRGQHVRLAGEDIARGALALGAGVRIDAAATGLLASLGLDKIPVRRRPRVALFSSGDEVCSPGEPLADHCIYDANRYSIKAMLTRLGCEIIDLGIIQDSEASLMAALQQGAECADLLISSGGVSVGDADYIKSALARLGQIGFWRIRMRPGRPLAFGKIGQTLFFGLPGNPVAVMVCMLQFVQPALRKLAGEANWAPTLLPAISAEPLLSRGGRCEFFRGIFWLGADGQLHVKTTGAQGSGMLSSMVRGNCLIILGESVEQLPIGSRVYIQPFADRL